MASDEVDGNWADDGPATTEIDGGVGRTVWHESDDLDEYEYGLGDAFVRWYPWGDERADDDLWKVTNIEWQFQTSWITDRDNPTTREDHRVYVLTSRETLDEKRVTESELKRGDWRPAEEVDDAER